MEFLKQDESYGNYYQDDSNWTQNLPGQPSGVNSQSTDIFNDDDDAEYSSKRRKQNDDFQLIRYSMLENNQDRQKRIKLKREEKKGKLEKKSEKSTTTSEFNSCEILQDQITKEELRKIKNRNSAQQSREKKKAHLQSVQEKNEQLCEEIMAKQLIIDHIIKENNDLKQQLQLAENARCPYCLNQFQPSIETNIYNEEQGFVRAQNITNRQLRTYGLLSLFTIFAILGCFTTTSNFEGSPVSFIQIRNITTSINKTENDKVQELVIYDEFKSDQCFQVSTSDHLKQIKNVKLENFSNKGIMNFEINLEKLPEIVEQYSDIVHSYNKERTFILNCSVSDEKCEILSKFFATYNIQQENIHKLSREKFNQQNLDSVTDSSRNFKKGDEISLINIFESQKFFMVNNVKCIVNETSMISFENELIDNLKL